MSIDINDTRWYLSQFLITKEMGTKYDNDKRTKARLKQLNDLGCYERALAEFGVKGKVSGIYIEKLWQYDDDKWNDYIKWIEETINK